MKWKHCNPLLFVTAQSNIPGIIIKPNSVGTLQSMPIIGLKPGTTKDSVRSAVPTPAIVTPRGHQNGTEATKTNAKQVQITVC